MQWGRGAAGSASDWQSGGHGFESRRLHHKIIKMKNNNSFPASLWCILFFIFVSGCGGGGYRDEALLGQSKKSLNRVKTSLEQYWLERGSYPPEGADLGDRLSKYIEGWDDFVKESFSGEPVYISPDSLTSYLVEVKARDHWKTPLVIRSKHEAREESEESDDK